MKVAGEAVLYVSDVCASASGDIHLAHLNFKGIDYDTMHKKVLKHYYEQLDEDYDSLAEFGSEYGVWCKNKNESAKRINWQSFDSEKVDRAEAVTLIEEVLLAVIGAMQKLYTSLNELTECPISIGICNWLQGRLEYWTKEVHYFNERRKP